ncbi:MAG: 2-oxo acid dehydrogenase subunit E2 [Methylocystaceae bacterium]
MAKGFGQYETTTFPASRLATFDVTAVGLNKHHVTALVELDVAAARQKIVSLKEQNYKVSFNAWILKCISEAVSQFGEVHGVKKGKRQVVIFKDVDISMVIEREVQGQKVPLPYVIRGTNNKSIEQIYDEIEVGKKQPLQDAGDNVLGEKQNTFLMKLYYMLPGFIRRSIWQYIIRNPFLTKQLMGTVVVTSVGTAGKVNGWVIPIGVHPLCFALGSIVQKPGVVDGRIEIREYLCMTVLVDHDVIDGAPAVRFLSKLTELVEDGYGL